KSAQTTYIESHLHPLRLLDCSLETSFDTGVTRHRPHSTLASLDTRGGWRRVGRGAGGQGLEEHLAGRLARPVDQIAQDLGDALALQKQLPLAPCQVAYTLPALFGEGQAHGHA